MRALEITSPVAPPAYVKPPKECGLTFALLGDSLTEHCNYASALTSITQTGGTATLTLAAHGLVPGDRIRIKGCTQAGYNGVRTILTVPTSGTATFAVNAATVSPATGTPWAIYEKRSNGGSWWAFFAGRVAGGVKLLGNFGVAGDTTTQMMARFPDVMATGADFVVIIGGHNDLFLTATDPSVPYANLVTMAEQVVAAGKICVLGTCEIDSGGAGITLARRKKVLELNTMIREYARGRTGVILFDLHAAIVNPTDANGYGLANVHVSDLMHLSCKGADLVGLSLYNALNKYLTPVDPRPSSAIEVGTRQVFTNPMCTGSGGSVSGVTGTVAAGLFAAKWSGTGTVVGSVAARTTGSDGDAIGSNQVVTWTTVANDVVQVGVLDVLSALGGATKVYAVCHLQITNPALLNTFKLGLNAQTAGPVDNWCTAFEWDPARYAGMNTPLNLVLPTPVMNVPAGAINCSFTWSAVAQSAGTCTVKIGRVGIYTAP